VTYPTHRHTLNADISQEAHAPAVKLGRLENAYHDYFYSAPVGERGIAISLFVCLSVCLSVCPPAYLRNRWTDLHEFFVQISCGSDSVLLWRRSDILCTSGLWMTSLLAVMGRMAMRGRLNL